MNMTTEIKRVSCGDVFKTKEGHDVTVVSVRGQNNVDIEFGCGLLINTRGYHVIAGSLRYPYHRSVHGVGFTGVGKHKQKECGKNTPALIPWKKMLERCYSKKSLEKYPNYLGCSVSEEWHNFQNFAEWYYSQPFWDKMPSPQVDKDLLVKGNREYSPDKCLLLPRQVNNLFIRRHKTVGGLPIGVTKKRDDGRYYASVSTFNESIKLGVFFSPESAFYAYKEAKEKHVRSFAHNEFSVYLTDKAKDAILSWEVNIDD